MTASTRGIGSALAHIAPMALLASLASGCSGGGGGGSTDSGEDVLPDQDADAHEDGIEDGAGDPDSGDVPGEDAFDEDGYTWPGFDPDVARILDDIEYLSSAALAGRETSTPGNDLALDHVEALFAGLGLEPAGDGGTYRHAFEYPRWTLDAPLSLAIGGTALDAVTEFDVLRYSGAGTVTAPLVFAGHGTVVPPYDEAEYPGCHLDPAGYDDYTGLDVTGAVVLVYGGVAGSVSPFGTPECPYQGVMAAAVERGAAAIVRLPALTQGPQVMHGIVATLSGEATPIPILTADRDLLEAMIPDLVAWRTSILETLLPDGHDTGLVASVVVETTVATATAENVVAAIRGIDPAVSDEIVVLGGHVDHEWQDAGTGTIFPGADDNASGTAITMEMARAVALGIVEPRRTVVFAAWNAEESGLFGSCAWAAAPSFPIEGMIAMLGLDALGGGGPGLLLPGGGSPQNVDLYGLMRGVFLASDLDGSIGPAPSIHSSDHACFEDAGVPSLMVTASGVHPTAHTSADTFDAIAPGTVEVAARVVWGTVEALATCTEDAYLE